MSQSISSHQFGETKRDQETPARDNILKGSLVSHSDTLGTQAEHDTRVPHLPTKPGWFKDPHRS
ncbi:hypothetical protein T484DRAFT_1947421 [Baffinella frigidus]|nr:hypothetical protein T484DRAFT_1947421 [Cryptophyta sp. CCMP2293]